MRRSDIVLPVSIAAAALTATVAPLPGALQFDRTAIIDHWQLWRLLTCHITHWSAEHCFWDLLAFAGAWFALAPRHPKTLWMLPLSSSLLISLWILLFNQEVEIYRGLSGVDVAMFAFLAPCYILRFSKEMRWSRLSAAILLALALAAKLAYEYSTGEALFAGGGPVLFSAHLAGAFSGALCFASYLFSGYKRQQPPV
jgi:rhomboid family GlyGly-CTERM serine protease